MSNAQEYVHEYVQASTISEKRGMMGMGAPEEIASNYPVQDIQSHLNLRGKDGWTLVKMEPHWYYERAQISAAMSITKPLAITGWYLTWSRSLTTISASETAKTSPLLGIGLSPVSPESALAASVPQGPVELSPNPPDAIDTGEGEMLILDDLHSEGSGGTVVIVSFLGGIFVLFIAFSLINFFGS